MGKMSTRSNKNIYQLTREALGLSREQASTLLETISPEKIAKIETEKMLPAPDEVMTMAIKYKKPELCNYYCAHECAIGKQYVPEVKVKDLSSLVLEMLASLNSMRRKQERLIEISADGKISNDEIDDFINIQNELEHISMTVEALQLWCEKMLAEGIIDKDIYLAKKN